MNDPAFMTQTRSSTISTNKVLRNTYFLLGLTLLWSAVVVFNTENS